MEDICIFDFADAERNEGCPVAPAEARAYCRRLLHKRGGLLRRLLLFLPRHRQRHVVPVFAFHLAVREAVRRAPRGKETLARLRRLRKELRSAAAEHLSTSNPILWAVGETMRTCGLLLEPFEKMLFAAEQEVLVPSFGSFEQLHAWCAHAAAPLGELTATICGCRDPGTLRMAGSLATAMRLAYCWHGLPRDLDRGLSRLPREECRRRGVSWAALFQRRATPAYARLMHELCERTRDLFYRSLPLVDGVPASLLPAAWLTIRAGLHLLDQLERRGYPLHTRSPRLGTLARGWLWLRTFWACVA